jgi:type IV pilus assembly protein PilC
MNWYHYRAYDGAGRSVTGALDAENVGHLETRLRAVGMWLLDAAETDARAPTAIRRRRTVRRRDLVSFFLQLSLLLKAGIPLTQALGRLAEDFRRERFGGVVGDLEAKVFSGVPLHQALAAHPRVFSRQAVAVVQAGEISGRLAEVFQSLSAYYEWVDQLVSDIRQALIYPVVVSSTSLGLVLLLFTLVVPRFVTLLQGLGMRVPFLTQVVMRISHYLVADWPGLLVLAVVLPTAFKLAMRSAGFARAYDRTLMRLPIFGPLVAMFSLSRFAHNLGLLYRAGIPLLQGLEICRGLVGNRAIAAALGEVRDGVAGGTPLSRCLAQFDFFPPALVTMIATGESSGTLGFALQNVSDYYNQIIPRRIKVVFAIFDPVVMLFLIGAVGCIALAVVLPILELWQAR